MQARLMTATEAELELAEKNQAKLIAIQKKAARLAKIKEIQEQEDAATSSAWYMNAWNYCVTPLTLVSEGLKSVVSFMSPVAVGLSWLHTAKTFKDLYQKKKRTFTDYGNAFFSLASSALSTTLLVTGATLLAPALPFIAIGVFGSFAAYGLFNFAKNIYRAVKAKNSDERWEHMKQAGKQLVGIVVNSLALAATVIFGVKMTDAIGKLNSTLDSIKDAVSKFDFAKIPPLKELATNLGNQILDFAATGAKVVKALTITAAIGVVANTARMNSETLSYIRHPSKIWYQLKARPLSIFKMIVMAPIRLATLAITGPFHALGFIAKGIFNCVRNCFAKKPAAPVMKKTTAPKKKLKQQPAAINADESQVLEEKIQHKIVSLDKQFPAIEYAPPTIQAKRFQMGELQKFVAQSREVKATSSGKSYASIDAIEKDAQMISRNVYGTFFKTVSPASEVKQLTDEARKLSARMAASAA